MCEFLFHFLANTNFNFSLTSCPGINRTSNRMRTHLWTRWYLQGCLGHLMLVLCKQLAEFRLGKPSLVRLRVNCLGGGTSGHLCNIFTSYLCIWIISTKGHRTCRLFSFLSSSPCPILPLLNASQIAAK